MTKNLTIAQVRELAKKLLGTDDDAGEVCYALFGIRWPKGIHKLLRKAGIFQCCSCMEWQEDSEEDSEMAGHCQPCTNDPESVDPYEGDIEQWEDL